MPVSLTSGKSQVMHASIASFLDPLRTHMQALADFLQAEIDAFEPEIQELVSTCMQSSGKRIRPVLLFYSGWKSKPSPDQVRAAAVLELVHQATLVHDDILDGASIRHNQATTNAKHNPHIAVLLGDALFSHALKLASDFETVDVCRAVSQATRRVCAGEIAQTFHHTQANTSIKDYYRVIQLKTAELFEIACELGAQLGGYEKSYASAVGEFGKHLGIAYQIYDDWADIVGDETSIGKSLGTDLMTGKFTLPTLLLQEKVDLKSDAFKNSQGQIDSNIIIEQLREHRIFDAIQEAFEKELNLAEQSLSAHKDKAPYPYLHKMLAYVRQQSQKLQ